MLHQKSSQGATCNLDPARLQAGFKHTMRPCVAVTSLDIFGQRWTLLCCITLQRQLQHLQPQGAVKQGHTYMYLLAHHNNARYALKCPIYAVGTMKHFDHDSARTCYPNQWKMKKRTKKIKQLINHQSLNQPAACVGKQTNPFDFRKNKK